MVTKAGLDALQEPDLEVLANMLEAIQDIVRLVGPSLLTLDQLAQAFERFRAVLDDSAKRRKERSAITAGEDFDEEEAEALEVIYHCPACMTPPLLLMSRPM